MILALVILGVVIGVTLGARASHEQRASPEHESTLPELGDAPTAEHDFARRGEFEGVQPASLGVCQPASPGNTFE